MKIRKLAIYLLEIPLNVHFVQANHSSHRSHSILVELETFGGVVGIGESCPRTYVTGEDVHSVAKDLCVIRPLLWPREFCVFGEIESFICDQLAPLIGPSALCALELALLDAWSKSYRIPIIHALGSQMKDEFHYTGVIPSSSITKLKPLLSNFHFPQIKLKMGKQLERNLSQIKAVQELYGQQIGIQADINTSWSWKDALQQIPVLINRGIRIFEQPFLPAQDVCMGELIQRFGDKATFMADESATTSSQVSTLLTKGHCTRINLKISKHGGIFQTLLIYREAQQYGVSCQLGAHFGETSVLTYAGMLVASIVPYLTGHEGGLGTYLLEADLRDPSLRFDRQARIYSSIKQGLGLLPRYSRKSVEPYSKAIHLSENPYCIN